MRNRSSAWKLQISLAGRFCTGSASAISLRTSRARAPSVTSKVPGRTCSVSRPSASRRAGRSLSSDVGTKPSGSAGASTSSRRRPATSTVNRVSSAVGTPSRITR